jgi:parallel beta-helix repeat protein
VSGDSIHIYEDVIYMRTRKAICCFLIGLFALSTIIFSAADAQNNEFTNYVIKSDGSIEPDNSAITHVGNNYFLTQNIFGSVTILRDDAVFNGGGYTLTGNAIKGTYDLDDSVLYLEAGFNLTKAWNVTVQNVRIENCVNGISLINAHYCRILNNTITSNAVDGMKIGWSANNMVFWNNITANCDDAIQMINAENNNIMVNYMSPEDQYRAKGNGIQLNGNCTGNKIKGNIIADFDTGLYIAVLTNDNASNNLASYNNFVENKWNGTAVEGEKNNITLNNFYSNGLISQGDNNCSSNYWENILPSFYDKSPLSSPVNINIEPEFMEIPQPPPTPTPTPSPSPSPSPTANPTSPTTSNPTLTPAPTNTHTATATPTPAPSAIPSTTPEESNPTSTPIPTGDGNKPQSTGWPIPLAIIIAIYSIIAVLAVILVIKRKNKQKTNIQ